MVICVPMQETRVQFLGGEDLLEKEMATHSSILPWKSHGQRSLMGRKRLGHDLATKQQQIPPLDQSKERLPLESLFWPSSGHSLHTGTTSGAG